VADKQISVRIVATGGDKMQAQFKAAGAAGTKAMNDIGRSAAANRANVQNAAYQVQDFFVQVASGTDPSRAMAQQLPQLLGSMGLVGVLAGTAAAALIPLGAAFLGAGNDAETAAKQVELLQGKIDDLNKINAVYSTKGIEQLAEKYGEVNAEVLLLLNRQRETKIEEAMAPAKAAVEELDGMFSGLRGSLTAFDNLMSQAADNPALAADAATWAESIQYEFGLTVEQARELVAAMDAVGAANGPGQQASAVANLRGMIEGSALETTELKQALESSEDTLRQLAASAPAGGWMNAAIGGVQALTVSLWDAVTANSALSQANARDAAIASANAIPGMANPDPNAPISPEESRAIDMAFYQFRNRPVKPRSGGGGGGGGANEALKEQNDLLREGEKVFEETRTEQERYAVEQERLNELLAAGAIDADTHARAIANLGEEFDKAAKTPLETFRDGLEGAASDLAKLIVQGGSLGDVMSSVFEKIAMDFAQQGIEGIFGLLFDGAGGEGSNAGILGKLLGGLFGSVPSFDGGGYTGNAARSGGLDGRGGFLALMHPRETVTDHTKGRPGQGGGVFRIEIVENPMFAATVQSQAQGAAVDVVKSYDGHLPDRVAQISKDRRRR